MSIVLNRKILHRRSLVKVKTFSAQVTNGYMEALLKLETAVNEFGKTHNVTITSPSVRLLPYIDRSTPLTMVMAIAYNYKDTYDENF